jgi:hypothetical protein
MARKWRVRRVIKWATTVLWLICLAVTTLTFFRRISLRGQWELTAGAIGKQQADVFIGLLPLWDVLVILAIPIMAFWILDQRKLPPGHCRCGYDLTGNISGICPECGTPVQPEDGTRSSSRQAAEVERARPHPPPAPPSEEGGELRSARSSLGRSTGR